LNGQAGHGVAAGSRQPEIESVSIDVRDAEFRKTILVAAVCNVRKTAEAEDTVVSAGCVPTTLGGSSYDALRIGNNVVVKGLMLPKQPSAHPFDSPFVQRPLLWRERLENHVILVVAARADARMIHGTYNVCASNCLQLPNQHANRLQRFLAKTTFRCHLMRSNDTLIDFIEQGLIERLEVIKRFVDD
jgi:hypothetical protein